MLEPFTRDTMPVEAEPSVLSARTVAPSFKSLADMRVGEETFGSDASSANPYTVTPSPPCARDAGMYVPFVNSISASRGNESRDAVAICLLYTSDAADDLTRVD